VHAAERCDADGLWQLTARHGGHDAVHSGFHGLVLADIMAVRDSAGLRRGLLWRNSSEVGVPMLHAQPRTSCSTQLQEDAAFSAAF